MKPWHLCLINALMYRHNKGKTLCDDRNTDAQWERQEKLIQPVGPFLFSPITLSSPASPLLLMHLHNLNSVHTAWSNRIPCVNLSTLVRCGSCSCVKSICWAWTRGYIFTVFSLSPLMHANRMIHDEHYVMIIVARIIVIHDIISTI